jgi:hypothetical protein
MCGRIRNDSLLSGGELWWLTMKLAGSGRASEVVSSGRLRYVGDGIRGGWVMTHDVEH